MTEEDKWDSENFRAQSKTSPIGLRSNQWDGEDDEEEEDEVKSFTKDSWDDPEEEDQDEKKKNEKSESESVIRGSEVKKNKKSLISKIEEKERKLQEELEKKMQKKNEANTPEEILAEKLRQQKLQEDADLEVAKHLLGVSKGELPELETKEDFEKYTDEIIRQLGTATKNQNFPGFVDHLVQQLCVHLSATELKKVHTWIGNLHIEKQKMEQGSKGKKKGKGKAKLNVDNATDIYTYNNEDLYDDFM